MLSLLVCCIIEFVWIILLERKCKKLVSSYSANEVKTDERI